jgi:hypothetical protein
LRGGHELAERGNERFLIGKKGIQATGRGGYHWGPGFRACTLFFCMVIMFCMGDLCSRDRKALGSFGILMEDDLENMQLVFQRVIGPGL